MWFSSFDLFAHKLGSKVDPVGGKTCLKVFILRTRPRGRSKVLNLSSYDFK